MKQVGTKQGGAKLVGITLIAVIAIAGIAGAVIFKSSRASERDSANAAPIQVQGARFNDPLPPASTASTAGATSAQPGGSSAPAARPEAPVAAAPATAPVAPAAAQAPQTPPAAQAANSPTPKAATAADVPADISKIPSATPVPQTQIASAAGGSPAPQASAGGSDVKAGDYKDISFQVLAGYKYIEPVPREGAKPEEIEAERKKNQIPADVVALTGSRAVVEGWMVPMQVDDNGGVKSFVLVKTQPQCCFGDTQKMNEWIDVAMPQGKTAEFNVDRPVKVYGTLEVGEKIEDGFVLSIYRMKADKVSG